jgi:hypothetical protein
MKIRISASETGPFALWISMVRFAIPVNPFFDLLGSLFRLLNTKHCGNTHDEISDTDNNVIYDLAMPDESKSNNRSTNNR